MAAFLMAGFAVGQAKTACPSYIEKQCKERQKTGSGFLMPIEHFHPVEREPCEEGKAE